MLNKNKAKIIFAMIGIFFIIVVLLDILHIIIWKETKAKIESISRVDTRVHATDNPKYSWVANYSFKVENEYYSGRINAGGNRFREGKEIKVWYNPKNPNQHTILDGTGIVIIIFGIIFLVVAVKI